MSRGPPSSSYPRMRVLSTLRLHQRTSLRASAKQSISPRKERMDCFVACASRNDGRCSFAPAARCARVMHETSAPKIRGRREDRVRAAPAVSRAMCIKKCAHEHTGSAETLRPSLRNGLTAYFVLSPVNGFLATVAALDMGLAQLDASTAASGPHDFAVRFSAVRRQHLRVHRNPPNVRDDGQRPSE